MKHRSRELERRGPSGAEPAPPPDQHLRILRVISNIPEGRVCTYGRIAGAAGLPGRARLVGRILRDSPLADGLPWHRVVSASGTISDRPGSGKNLQRRLLTAEGVEIGSSNHIDLSIYLWMP